jgi:hypothetical protein
LDAARSVGRACRFGQSSGIELGIDGLGELDFTGTIMSQRQQPDDRVAGLLLAVTDEQRFEGAPVLPICAGVIPGG